MATRVKPIFMFSVEPPYVLVREPQRPDQELEQAIIAEFSSKEELALYELKSEKSEQVEVASTQDINHMSLEQLAWYNNQLEISAGRLMDRTTTIKTVQQAVVNRRSELKKD